VDDGTSATTQGRRYLVAWQEAQPDNYFTADTFLQRMLQRTWGAELYAANEESLVRSGRICAQVIEPLVREADHPRNLPRLERYSGVGVRTEQVVYDGRYDEIGKHVYGAGVISVLEHPGNNLLAGGLGFLSNQNGEAGHNCPVACTAGIVRALQSVGSDALKARYLPRLLNSDYSQLYHGAQFLTEVQGGSDVGANTCRATLSDEGKGEWRIHGEKWFCSNVTADLILMTARPDGAPEGTRGLGLFLVPRLLDDGSINNFHVRRLKEKLGTRVMASGEIDFDGCTAYNVGPVDQGFNTVINQVINVSRLHNAIGTLAMARRALTVGWTYSRHRQAFGRPIGDYPLVQETLVQMRSELTALLAVTVDLHNLRDQLDLGQQVEHGPGFFRVMLNLNKYRTAASAGEIIRQGIELLGGNGAIESFSPLPRLLRDNVVYENWEGTHNTLRMQVLRDMARLDVGREFIGWLSARFGELTGGSMDAVATRGLAATQELAGDLAELQSLSPELAGLRMRPLGDRMSWLAAASSLAGYAAWDIEKNGDHTAVELLEYFWNRRLVPGGESRTASPQDLKQLAALAAGI
jgi:acyl-CoA dehydrogenase